MPRSTEPRERRAVIDKILTNTVLPPLHRVPHAPGGRQDSSRASRGRQRQRLCVQLRIRNRPGVMPVRSRTLQVLRRPRNRGSFPRPGGPWEVWSRTQRCSPLSRRTTPHELATPVASLENEGAADEEGGDESSRAPARAASATSRFKTRSSAIRRPRPVAGEVRGPGRGDRRRGRPVAANPAHTGEVLPGQPP